MTYRNAWAPARPVDRTIGILAKTAALSFALALALTSAASAQQPKKPPAKKPAPTPAQQQPTPPPAAAPQQPQLQLIYSPWTKFCRKEEDPKVKEVCFTAKDARVESGMPVAGAVLIEPQGLPKKIFRITLPLGVAIVNGTRVLIDQAQPLTAPYVACISSGCLADYEATPEMIAGMKKGKGMYLQAILMNGQPLTVPMSLSDFGKAYDGPPTDPKVFEAQQQKLQEELQKRAEEARKKLEESRPGAGATAAPPPNKTQ